MATILNIGLKTADGTRIIPTLDAYTAAQKFLGTPTNAVRRAAKGPDDEPTLVLTYWWAPPAAAIDRLSTALHQDCIAVLDDVTGVGRLIGPNAAAWGAFNPAFFKR